MVGYVFASSFDGSLVCKLIYFTFAIFFVTFKGFVSIRAPFYLKHINISPNQIKDVRQKYNKYILKYF